MCFTIVSLTVIATIFTWFLKILNLKRNNSYEQSKNCKLMLFKY